MGICQLRFIFGIGLSEASLKCTLNFFKNSLRENISIYEEVQATLNRKLAKMIASFLQFGYIVTCINATFESSSV